MKAESLAEKLVKSDFKEPDGWLNRWLKRENIVFCKPHGEQAEADNKSADDWISTEWFKLRKNLNLVTFTMRMKLVCFIVHCLNTHMFLKVKTISKGSKLQKIVSRCFSALG